MLGLVIGLSVLLGIASFVGFVWLAMGAFRNSTGWGLAVLFIPFAALVYAAKNWQESKRPFLLYAGSAVASGVLGVVFSMMAVSQAASAMEAAMNDPAFQQQMQQMAEQAGSEFETQGGSANGGFNGLPAAEPVGGGATGTPELTVSSGALPPTDAPSPVTPSLTLPNLGGGSDPIAASQPKTVTVSRLKNYIGSRIRVVGRGGLETTATLTGVRGNRIQLERDLGGGVATFSMRNSEIQSVHLMPN